MLGRKGLGNSLLLVFFILMSNTLLDWKFTQMMPLSAKFKDAVDIFERACLFLKCLKFFILSYLFV